MNERHKKQSRIFIQYNNNQHTKLIFDHRQYINIVIFCCIICFLKAEWLTLVDQ